ncbi:adenine phosphoribosyltransferase [Nocardioides terrisoli]|uniref:adenine phosphoribosyltransferase n=1 Tax=Nocardioides terrisoli TaxID=3388267 RepID=UPI00287B8FD7|nr:adenine phosphoribosyltransferase [Nocardioides marmorisolisilvae]
MTELATLIEKRIRDIPDFPKPGVMFKDITPLLDDHLAFTEVVRALAAAGRDATGAVAVDKVVGMEARGFILAAPVALALGVGFIPVRKPGKLPWQTHRVSYDLEYGSETLEMHVDAVAPGERVLLVDDVLATGGTAAATAELVETCGGAVTALAVLMELSFLDGRSKVGDLPVTALYTV